MSSSYNKLPSLRPEHSSARGSADPRAGQLRPLALKLEPRPVTRVKESQRETREFCELCDEIPQTLQEARLVRDEVILVREEVRLAHARAQREIRKESRQIREEMHRMCADIYQLQQFKDASLLPSQITSPKSSIVSFPLDSPKTPIAMEGSNFINVQEDKEGLH